MKQNSILEATHTGKMKIGELEIPCYVLPNGTRVLNQTGVMKALGIPQTNSITQILSSNYLQPFITKEYKKAKRRQRQFKVKNQKGGYHAAYDATLLVELCNAIVNAEASEREQGRDRLKYQAIQARILQSAFAKTGITALIDEATGYDQVRQETYEQLCKLFLNEEAASWAKTFPDEYYKEMFRLNNWEYRNNSKRPPKAGEYTIDVVYERLAVPELIEQIREKNPKTKKGRRKAKHHQWLSKDIGKDRLKNHLSGVLALMRASSTWHGFKKMLDTAYPKKDSQIEMPISES